MVEKTAIDAVQVNSDSRGCAAADCGCAPSRREVLRFAVVGAVASLAARLPAFAGPFEASDFSSLVPPDKKLAPEWVRSLTERGVRASYRGAELDTIGMPIGGIGAGQLYLGGDGRLWHWDIFNITAGTGDANYAHPPKPSSPLEQGFALKVARNGKWAELPLDRRGFSDITFRGEYPLAQVEYRDPTLPVQATLEAFSPFIPLNTDDSSLPATVMRYTLTNTSGHPAEVHIGGWLENAVGLHTGKVGTITRRNGIVRKEGMICLECSATPVVVPATQEARPDILFDDFEKPAYDGWTTTGTAFGKGPIEKSKVPAYQGDVGAHGDRLVNSHNTRQGEDVNQGDAHTGTLTSKAFTIERNFITFLIGGGGHKDKTCLNLLIDDKVVASATGKNNNHMDAESFDVRAWKGKTARLRIVDEVTGVWGNIGVDNIVFSDSPPAADLKPQDQPDFGTMALAVLHTGPGDDVRTITALPDGAPPAGIFPVERAAAAAGDQATDRPIGQKLTGSLAWRLLLEPNEKTVVTFVVAWHFPNLKLDPLPTDGRWYAKKFDSAVAVVEHIAKNYDRLADQTLLWHNTWYDSTLPYWFLDRTFTNTSTLATSTCFRFGSGRFYGWEGVGCCPGTCGHVWHYAQAVARLFPDLERSCREMVDYRDGVGFDPKSGAIDFRAEFHNGWAADGQAGTILRVYREHQMSGDGAFLKRLWPKVKQSIQFLIDQDGNGDGILEGAQPNTLDTTWFGAVSWLSSLYQGALHAGAAMATEQKDAAFAARCREIAEKGAKKLVDLCWNGEYFIHHPDPKRPEAMKSGNGCEIDQVFGQSWAFQVGLGRIISEKYVKGALASLWKYNFTPDVGPFRRANPTGRWYAMAGEGGMLICTWPKGDKADAQGKAPDWAFGYFNECMSGFEHQVASHMIWEGMLTEGLAVVRAIHDRYHPSRRNPWNEVECGDHYARAMASYGEFIAACGFTHHGPNGHLGFAPRLSPENFRAPFTTAEGWGTFSQQSQPGHFQGTVDLKFGRLRLKTLALAAPAPGAAVTVTAAGKAVPVKATAEAGQVQLTFERELMLNVGNKLEVRWG